VEIREYRASDKLTLIELLRLNTPKFFAPEEEQDLIDYLENEIEKYFVVEIKGDIIGAGGINLKGTINTGYISWDFIHPAHQGKGIGALLLNHRINLLRADSAIEMIKVRTTQHVFKFYEKCGFQLIDIAKDYWAEGFDLYNMEIRI
jgi:N-acetylglutamate synthase-like GNAT family acetyltransferase